MHDTRRPDDLLTPPLEPAGRVDQQVVTGLDGRDRRLDELPRVVVAPAALLGHLGNLERVDDPHDRVQERNAVRPRVDERPERSVRADVHEDEGRVDVAGMVRQHEDRSLDVPKCLEPADAYAVPQREHQPCEPSEKRSGELPHGSRVVHSVEGGSRDARSH